MMRKLFALMLVMLATPLLHGCYDEEDVYYVVKSSDDKEKIDGVISSYLSAYGDGSPVYVHKFREAQYPTRASVLNYWFHKALKDNDFDKAKIYLKHGSNIVVINEEGERYVQLLADRTEHGTVSQVIFLLEHGANPNVEYVDNKKRSLLDVLLSNRCRIYYDIAKELYRYGGKTRRNFLSYYLNKSKEEEFEQARAEFDLFKVDRAYVRKTYSQEERAQQTFKQLYEKNLGEQLGLPAALARMISAYHNYWSPVFNEDCEGFDAQADDGAQVDTQEEKEEASLVSSGHVVGSAESAAAGPGAKAGKGCCIVM